MSLLGRSGYEMSYPNRSEMGWYFFLWIHDVVGEPDVPLWVPVAKLLNMLLITPCYGWEYLVAPSPTTASLPAPNIQWPNTNSIDTLPSFFVWIKSNSCNTNEKELSEFIRSCFVHSDYISPATQSCTLMWIYGTGYCSSRQVYTVVTWSITHPL